MYFLFDTTIPFETESIAKADAGSKLKTITTAKSIARNLFFISFSCFYVFF